MVNTNSALTATRVKGGCWFKLCLKQKQKSFFFFFVCLMLSVSGEGFTYSVMFCIFEHDWGWDIGKRRMTKMKRDLSEIPLN